VAGGLFVDSPARLTLREVIIDAAPRPAVLRISRRDQL
jgi:hypothetical protein